MSTDVVPARSMAQVAVLFAARIAGRGVGPFLRPIRMLMTWPVTSQLGARDNARAAEEELLLRRTEREEVKSYLELLASERMPV